MERTSPETQSPSDELSCQDHESPWTGDRLQLDIIDDILSSDGDVRIDMPRDDNVPAEQNNSHRSFQKSIVDFIKKEGLAYLSSSSTNVPVLPWARTTVEVAKILGYAFTAAGLGTLNYGKKLSRFFIKAGAIATATSVILALALQLPPVVGWTVGLLAWVTVAAIVAFN